MNFDEIVRLLNYREEGGKVFVPNEIFDELPKTDLLKRGFNETTANPISFAFAFYYLSCYLYRECKYADGIDTKVMKKILGYHENYKGVDYIIKKDGVLDKLGYTETTTNYPIHWRLIDGYTGPFFTTLSDLSIEERKLYNVVARRIKVPVKALHRTPDSKGEDWDGTFYWVENTTMIPFEVFMFCMGNDDLGIKAFYLYSYILYKSNYFGGSFNEAFPALSDSTGFSSATLTRTLKELEGYGMITNSHEHFIYDRDPSKTTDANTYSALKFSEFRWTKNKVKTRKVMSNEEHDKLLEQNKNLPF